MIGSRVTFPCAGRALRGIPHENAWKSMACDSRSLPISCVEAQTLVPAVQTLCRALTEDNPQRCGLTSS